MDPEIKRKSKPKKIEDMTKDQIRETIIKKRECNAKAQMIVQSLLENPITEAYLLKCLPDINQNHFEDVIEERSIIKLCGYPLCQNLISEKEIPKQKYRISVKTNKVYDITTRKSFCSNSCYKAAMYVKSQMLTSPLWFREYEVIPEFQILNLDPVGFLGQEVDVTSTQRISAMDKQQFFSSHDFTSEVISKVVPLKNNEDYSKCGENNIHSSGSNDSLETVTKGKIEANYEHLSSAHNQSQSEIPIKKTLQSKTIKNTLNIVGDIVEKSENAIDLLMVNETKGEIKNKSKTFKGSPLTMKKEPSFPVITIEVEKCFAEWFTIDTLLLLFGEEKVKEMITDKGERIKGYFNNYNSSVFNKSNTYDQYQILYRKLNILELGDKKFDSQTIKKKSKPLPDYSILQEESKILQLKVKSYFAGSTEIRETPTSEKGVQVTEEETTHLTQLPLVDGHSQNALRRQIVCQHLNKVLPDILRSLGMLSLSITTEVRMLVNTFNLKPNNIMFKPIHWTLIGIIVLRLVALRDSNLEFLLKEPKAYQHMQLLLLSYKQDGGYFDRLILWLTDIDRLLNSYESQLTTE